MVLVYQGETLGSCDQRVFLSELKVWGGSKGRGACIRGARKERPKGA